MPSAKTPRNGALLHFIVGYEIEQILQLIWIYGTTYLFKKEVEDMQKITLRNQRAGTSAKHNQHDHIEDKNQEEMALTFFNIENGSYKLQKLKQVKLPRIEFKFYEKNYQKALDAQNHKYMQRRQTKRIKKMSDWLTDKNKRPDEQILQIGSKKQNEPIDRLEFERIVIDYVKAHEKKFGSNIHIIDVAFHYKEEGMPHVHIRSIADYDNKGIITIGLEKALQALGIERPDLKKKESRYNNRKMTYTEMERQLWIDICKEHGIEVDTEVKEGGRKHQEVAVYKAQQELVGLQSKIDSSEKWLQTLKIDIEEQKALSVELDQGITKKFEEIDKMAHDQLVDIAMQQIYLTDSNGEYIVKNGQYFLTPWAVEMCDQIKNETLADITNTSIDHVKEVAENMELLKYMNKYFIKLKRQVIDQGRSKEYGMPQKEQNIYR